jgi:hypothetical protein
METVPNREQSSLVGRGQLLVSCPRNHTARVETVLGREAETWSDGVEVGPPSDVTIWVKSSLIREGALLPPVVRRCLVGSKVFQTQRTGRVARVGAAALKRGRRASVLQGSGRLVPMSGSGRTLSGWHRTEHGRRKSGRGKPNINGVHYW